jgi:hypothetical protein
MIKVYCARRNSLGALCNIQNPLGLGENLFSVGNWCLRLTVANQLYRGISCAGHSAKHGFPAKQGFSRGRRGYLDFYK